jgi:hypothetical protein
MPAQSIPEASATLYTLLEPFTSDERIRIIKGTLMLLGQAAFSIGKLEEVDNDTSKNENNSRNIGEASEYFKIKSPQTKTEELAVAARFLEKRDQIVSCKREDLEAVFSDARVNFDGKRFKDNIVNAMKSACFFNTGGTKKTGYTLSSYGQNYVDALPDREAARALQRPRPTKVRKPRLGKKDS